MYDCAQGLNSRQDREAPQAGVQPALKHGLASNVVRTQPCQDIRGLVAVRRADLQPLRTLPKRPPATDGGDGQAGDPRLITFVQGCLKSAVCSCHLILSRVALLPPRFKDWASRLAGIKAGEDANQIENSLYDAYGPRWAAKRGSHWAWWWSAACSSRSSSHCT